MSKYINLEKLIAEIENQQRRLCVLSSNNETELRKDAATQNAAYSHILSIIESLQQEQQDILVLNKKDWKEQEQFRKDKKFGVPLQQEQPEVDLEKEIQNYFQGHWPGMETPEQCNTDMHFTPPAIMRLVKYAYELGFNARKEESK